MDGIRQWAFSACVAMVACGIARIILPKSNLQKVFSITVSVFFLCCLALPMLNGLPGISLQLDEAVMPDIERRAAILEETAISQAEGAAAEGIEKIILEKLAEMGINHGAITINITTNGQHEPEVERADILLDAIHEPEHDRIRAELSQSLGFAIRLGYEEIPQEE